MTEREGGQQMINSSSPKIWFLPFVAFNIKDCDENLKYYFYKLTPHVIHLGVATNLSSVVLLGYYTIHMSDMNLFIRFPICFLWLK